MKAYEHRAFSGYGVEIEYMIVDAETLDVLPIADQLLDAVGGAFDMDVPRGDAAWSNELALHVIEIKTARPMQDLAHVRGLFEHEVKAMSELLRPLGARLLPGGMHPWMNPELETRLWPHQNDVIYRTFDRIFDCRGHGWSNLQSTHINFPFGNDDEFARLHAACRVVLPLAPALAASSPFLMGQRAAHLDARLFVYQDNCARIPSVAGKIIPERIFSEAAYQDLLQGIYADLAPHDPAGILAEEWVNARGCIARFDRGSIEIRLLDAQECPAQDIALVAFFTELVQALYLGKFAPMDEIMRWEPDALLAILASGIARGQDAALEDPGYAALFGSSAHTLGELLAELVPQLIAEATPERTALDLITREGPLGQRLLKRLGQGPVSRERLAPLYRELGDCLTQGRPLLP